MQNAKDWIELQLSAPAFLGHISFQDKVQNWAIAQLSHNGTKKMGDFWWWPLFHTHKYLYMGRTPLTALRCQDKSKCIFEPPKKSLNLKLRKTMYLSYQSKLSKMSTNGSICQLGGLFYHILISNIDLFSSKSERGPISSSNSLSETISMKWVFI